MTDGGNCVIDNKLSVRHTASVIYHDQSVLCLWLTLGTSYIRQMNGVKLADWGYTVFTFVCLSVCVCVCAHSVQSSLFNRVSSHNASPSCNPSSSQPMSFPKLICLPCRYTQRVHISDKDICTLWAPPSSELQSLFPLLKNKGTEETHAFQLTLLHLARLSLWN